MHLLPFAAFVIAACVPRDAAAQESQPAVTPQRHPLLKVVEQFDPLDTSKLQLVRVHQLHGTWRSNRLGWVVAKDGAKHDIRYLDLGRESLLAGRRVRIENITIADASTELRTAIREMTGARSRRSHYTTEQTPLHPRTLALLLARACELRGLHEAKDELLQVLFKDTKRHAADLRVRNTIDTSDPAISWETLQQRSQLLDISFPKTERQLLRPVVDPWAKAIEATQAGPDDVERILVNDPWIESTYMFDAGHSTPTAPKPAGKDRAYNRLLARGLAVVPELIALLDDLDGPTISRSLTYSSRHGGHFWSNSVADQASAALREITGAHPRNSHLPGQRRNAWQQWYDEHKDRTLRDIFEERIRNHLRHNDVESYVSRWPDGASKVLDAIAAWPHRRVPSGAVLALLENEQTRALPKVQDLSVAMVNEITPSHWRVPFAIAMFEAKVPGAMDAIRRAWTDRNLFELKPANHLDDAAQNLRMLMLHGNADDWKLLQDSNEHDTVMQRSALVLLSEPDLLAKAGLGDPARKEVFEAARPALWRMLRDTAPRFDRSVIETPDGPAVAAELACADAAAFALAEAMPQITYRPVRERAERHLQLRAIEAVVAK